VIDALERGVAAAGRKADEPPGPPAQTDPAINALKTTALDHVDMSLSLTAEEYDGRLKKAQTKLRELEHQIYRRRVPVVIAYEGWDAAGKGGNIRRLTQNLDPRGYEVAPIAAPNDIEKAHHYLCPLLCVRVDFWLCCLILGESCSNDGGGSRRDRHPNNGRL
jgi:polyphosphate kinase 2 (PPK2 family)